MSVETIASDSSTKEAKNEDSFKWIINDGLLRDEGVLFGMSGANPAEKIHSIENYYASLKSIHIVSISHLGEAISQLRFSLEQISNKLESLLTELRQARGERHRVTSGNLSRYSLGFLLMIIAIGGSYRILNHYVTPEYGQMATIGIFFFALFCQMVPISSWVLKADETNTFVQSPSIRYLLEMGPALSATLFCGYLIYTITYDIVLAILISFFLFLLLFFSGKLILAISQFIFQDLRMIRISRSTIKDKSLEIELLNTRYKETTIELNRFEQDLKTARIAVDELTEVSNHKTKLFMSEYTLATEFSKTLK